MSVPPIIVAIFGATATGKSELALAVAGALAGEIISVDSRQIYCGMDIGTDKPSESDRRRVPHHLIDVAQPDETWSLAQYQRRVARSIDEITCRGRLPMLVGGTGLHMRAVLEGWNPPPRPADPDLRRALEAEAAAEPAALVERLRAVDPESAASIDPRNLRRVIRALEIHQITGRPASLQRGRTDVGFQAIRIGLQLPRPELYARIDSRIEGMIQQGLVDEVRGLLAAGFGRDLPSMSAIGYREIAAHLAGEISLEEAVALLRRATRSLVRRQANWFRTGDPTTAWFTPEPGYVAEVAVWLKKELSRTTEERP